MSRADRIAVVSPRFPEAAAVGGAETLLRRLAERAARAGRAVEVLTTCARSHFTWANEIPAGRREFDGLRVQFFPVDDRRDAGTFLRVQDRISRQIPVSADEEQAWLANSVNSPALCDYLRSRRDAFDRILAGPYLFGLTYAAADIAPDRTFLVPCLHDEPFARVGLIAGMFRRVRGHLFNTEPERDLARRLYGLPADRCHVVGMGLDPFSADPAAFARRRRIEEPYLLYAGRREPLKGTGLLLDYFQAFLSRTRRRLALAFTGTGELAVPPEIAGRVVDAGFVSEDEKHEAMAGAVAFCHPSPLESLSIVLLESWLAGTPALVTDRSEVMRELCRRGGGGLWFRNYPEFEESLVRLLDDPGLRRRMGESGRAFVRAEYAWPRIEERLFTALDRS